MASTSTTPAMWLADVRAVVIRNLIRIRRSPDIIVFTVLQPIMFVLLFSQVFGGAIHVPGTSYENFLMPGIFVQSAIFGSTTSGLFIANDKKDGLISRYKTLPMARSAVVFGRTVADIVLASATLLVMVLAGLAIGWRPESFWGFAQGYVLLLVFVWAFSWLMVTLGLVVPRPEAMNSATFITLFPLTFLSNAFVPQETMPTPLRIFAEWNPLSALVQALRDLFGNNGGVETPDVWSLQNPVALVLIGAALFFIIFCPLAVRAYDRKA
ncbi:ABC transporter permease [Corynebacterium propinquum]|uniref:ABC transporter permease n=1 Tax=Corynebacterium propinquum TaxID=43769 RepID=UPI000DAFB93A|nr:ABC transporter permease [Corynebacterium propinquum]MDK4257970.1 ABC transporter permease [Corynebacterium propinquum]MDK4281999.1 ABC transporter permease [Corynebacterium propinquum]MDK4297969.1 ABC transporter permease [Corynebacterium propinquum]MDK4319759.1 ABC transporter permease [Corynebacterium propinquum]PZQ27451.1 MAG: ABC transporter [Corynebacterium propinquum]